MTTVNTGMNSFAQYTAYARAAAAPSLGAAISSDSTGDALLGSNAATTLTLSDAARAQLAAASAQPDFTTITNAVRDTLDGLYTQAKVTGPIVDGKQTIDLSSLDRRSLFAISTNSNNKFSPDEQAVATTELKNRFNAALAPSTATTRLTGDYSVSYKAALDYLDAASPEEKATATWSTQRAAVLKGYQATQQDPTTLPPAAAGDPVAPVLAQDPVSGSTNTTRDFSDVANDVRAFLDGQAADAAKNHKELVYDPQRKTGQQADLSSLDNRSLSAITLNQGNQFSGEEIYAAKKLLDGRTRTSILGALQKSQSSGDPRQLSLGMLQSYSAMSPEERQAVNWTPQFQDTLVQNYKTTSNLLSALQPSSSSSSPSSLLSLSSSSGN
jgi:hypothetical protein